MTDLLFLSENSEDMIDWSDPFVTIMGLMGLRNRVMSMDFITTGLKSSRMGYIDMGDIVPEVSYTLLNELNTGRMAREESKQARERRGSAREPSNGLGSRMRVNWEVLGVETMVAKLAMVVKPIN
jgi:hypothetical protein